MPSQPSNKLTKKERLAYVADVAAEMRRLVADPQFRTVAYLLDMVRL